MRGLAFVSKFTLVLGLLLWATPSTACPPSKAPTFRIVSTADQTIRIWLWPTSQQAVPETQRLENCGWSRTEWQFATDPSQFVDYDYSKYRTDFNFSKSIDRLTANLAAYWVSGSNRFPDNPFSLDIDLGQVKGGQALDHSKKYFVRVRALSDLGVMGGRPTIFWSSPWSNTLNFVAADFPCQTRLPDLFAEVPRNNTKNLAADFQFRLTAVDPLPEKPCIWDATEIEMKWRDGNSSNTRSATVPRSDNLATHTFSPPVALIENTSYEWRARTRSKQQGGDWTVAHTFTTAAAPPPPSLPLFPPPQPLRPLDPGLRVACLAMAPPILLAPLHGTQVDALGGVQLRLGFGSNASTCRLDEVAWQVLDAATGDYVFQTGFTPDSLSSLTIPAGHLQIGKQYAWRVKLVSRGSGPNGEDVFSDWTPVSGFSTR